MDLTNNWVGYLDRSAEQIKQAVKDKIISVLPELYDDSDNNPQNVIIDIFAGMTEMLNYYIDSYARESFIGTAQMYKSMVNLTRVLDYRIKTNYPPTVDLVFTLNEVSDEDILIPKNTAVTNGQYTYLTDKEATIPAGQLEVSVSASNRILHYMQIIGVTDGVKNQNQIIDIPSDYVQGTAQITINSETYNLVDSFFNQGPEDKVFIVDVNEDKGIYVKMGDGLNSFKLDTVGLPIYLTYESTQGATAFATANSLINILSTITLPENKELSVTNPKNSTMGAEIENIESIRRNAPLSVRTLGVGITRADIEDLAKGFGDIKHAYLAKGCGKEHSIFVSPEQPDNSLVNTITDKQISDLEYYLNQRIVFSNVIKVKKLQIAKIHLSVDIYLEYLGNASAKNTQTTSVYQAVVNALAAKYGYNASRINSSVFLSDIIYLIDDQDGVDHNDNLKITMDPIFDPDSADFPLNGIKIEMLSSERAYDYKIYRQSQTSIRIMNTTTGVEGSLSNEGETDTYYNDGIVNITWSQTYVFPGDAPSQYGFRVYPNNSNIVITDSIALPVIFATSQDPSVTNITLHKQLADGTWE